MEILTIQSRATKTGLIKTRINKSDANRPKADSPKANRSRTISPKANRSRTISPKANRSRTIRSKADSPKVIRSTVNNTGIERSRLVGKDILVGLILIFSSLLTQAQDYSATKDAFQQSYIQEATGDVTVAINSLKKVYQENSYELNLRLGWLSYQAGNFTESTAYYNKAIDLMPYAVEPRFGIVYPGAAMGNWTMVVKQYEKILEITPNNSIAMHRLGLIYYGRAEYEKARQYFDKVVNLYPFDYDALTMLAWSHFRLQNMRESRVLFQKALLNTPSGSSALEGLELVK